MKTQKIVWLLSPINHLGIIPQCALVKYKNDIISLDYTLITSKNKHNYINLLDETEKGLLKTCLKLETENIRQKVNDKEANTWEKFAIKYIVHQTNSSEILKIREYLKDIINQYKNLFYENINDKPLYFFNGDIPSLWAKIFFEESKPEVFYIFDYSAEGIKYELQILNDNKVLKIANAQLLNSNPARILLKNYIYQFENEINGNSLTPFFSKSHIQIPPEKSNEYFNKFIHPLLLKNTNVIANGFTINDLDSNPKIILEISSIVKPQQLSMFDVSNQVEENHKLKFELSFYYSNFRYQYGINTNTVFLKNENNEIVFYRIERDLAIEREIVKSLLNLGINLKLVSHIMPFEEGMNWINENYQAVENMGIEIIQEQKSPSQKKYFIGQSTITASASESIDWFEISGTVTFGDYTFQLKEIILLIKKNKTEIRLPNGEYAVFPSNWIKEYSFLGLYLNISDDKILASKHYFVLLDEISKTGLLKLDLNSKLRALIDSAPIKKTSLPKGFVGKLRKYQHEGFNWLVFINELRLGGCLADDMGLGKTVQTLCLLQWAKEKNHGASLIVVPKTLLYNWEKEAKTFCPDLKIYSYSGPNRKISDSDFFNSDVILTTYSIVRIDIETFENKLFNYCILDESQNIKNSQSGTAKACMQLKANHFLTLTGTPIENSITDLWTQMHFVNRNIFGSLSQFQKEYNTEEKLQILKKIVNPFILRRLKSRVAKDLPEKTISINYCEMNAEQQEFYLQIKNQYRHSILSPNEDSSKIKFNLLEGLLRLRQIANHPKLYDKNYSGESGKFNEVCEMLIAALSYNNKTLIFSSFTEHLKLFKNYLEEQNTPFCYLDGQTKDREQQVSLFQNNPDYKVFLLSLKAGGLGLNLTEAEYVFLLDPWWNPAAEAQAYDRAHRIGQKKNVFIYKFISQGSIEEKIIELQNKKIKLSETLIQSEEGFVKSLNKEDIEYLLS